MSDPANQGMWCKENDWTIGAGAGEKPFIVKMISTTPGSSRNFVNVTQSQRNKYQILDNL
jgi:hypothetical protein